jgi:hypothetical protein
VERVPNISLPAEGQGIGVFQVFDAELDRARCLLTLEKKIEFAFRKPPAAPDPSEPEANALFAEWPESEKARFTQRFIAAVTNRWRDKFDLEPVDMCPSEPCSRVHLGVRAIPVKSGGHITLEASFMSPKSTFPAPGPGVIGSRAHMTNVDLDPRKTEGGAIVPAEHEFGHMLGVEHIHCPGEAPVCRGVTAQEKRDIMGWGSEVSERDYRPFVDVMNTRFGKGRCTWRVSRPGVLASIWSFLTEHPLGTALSGAAAGAGVGALLSLIPGVGLGAAVGVGALVGGGLGLGYGALK